MRRDLPDGHGKIPKHPTALPSPSGRVRVRENAVFNLTCGHRIFENVLEFQRFSSTSTGQSDEMQPAKLVASFR
jgi:hypothetical protein